MSPILADRFLTTGPPEKSRMDTVLLQLWFFRYIYIHTQTHAHIYVYVPSHFSRVQSLRPPWTVACHTPPSMEILQARILEWVACPSSRGPSPPRDRTPVSYVSCIGRQVLYPLVPPGKPFMYIYVKTLHQNGHLEYMCYLLCINHPSKAL